MLIYCDVETTGIEYKDRICSVGIIAIEGDKVTVLNELIHPGQKIRPSSMMINHITNEMVKEKAKFEHSKVLAWLNEHNSKENTFIAHNSSFDLAMLAKEGFLWQGKVIDTLRCVKHLITECEQFALQFLRYELQLYKNEHQEAAALGIDLNAHSASSDVLHVKMLHEYLRDLADDERLESLTQTHALVPKMTFGKYKGRFIEEIAMKDRGYLEWMLNAASDIDDDLRYSITHFLDL